MSTFTKTLILLFIITFSLSSRVAAQGSISGTIIDASINSSLPGAAVLIKGTNYGTISDIYGNYTLTGVAEGTHELRFSFIGYNTLDTLVTIKKGESLNLNITLDVKAVIGQEVVVTAMMLGQSKAINQQLNSDAIANMVSEDKLKELPDANAAEAVGRIPGISLLRDQGEGQKVVVRGLEPRFSSITVNGIKVPSNDPNDKSVDLSMISPELLQGIEVYKSPTPDMDAEAVGGTVNLLLNKAAEKSQLKINASGGYSALRDDYSNYNFSAAYNKRFFDSKLGMIVQANTERVNRGSDKIKYSYYLDQDNDIDVLSNRSVEQRKINEIRKRSGGSINLDYKLKQGELTFYSLYSNTYRDFIQRNNYYNASDAEGRLDYNQWNGNSSLLSNMLSGKHTIGRVKTDWSLSYAETQNKRGSDFDMEFRNKRPFGGRNDLIDYDFNTWIEASDLSNVETTYLYEMSSDQRDISEANTTAAINFELPLQINNNWSISTKIGGKYNILNRIRADKGSWEPWYYFGIPGKTQAWDDNYPYPYYLNSAQNNVLLMRTFANNSQAESFINGTQFFNPISETAVNNFHNYFKDDFLNNRAKEVNNSNITETITAGYAMAKIKYKNLLTVIAGVRAEQSDNEYQSKISSLSGWDNQIGTIQDTVNTQKYTELFPHLHVKYEPSDWYSLRFSAAKTMARPNYNYVAYSAYVNDNSAEIDAGNPNIKHMTAMNYDLNMTFYNGKFGLLSIGGFYKNMENIFYEVGNLMLIDDQMAADNGWPDKAGYSLSTYGNSPKAEVYGFEVDLQTNLNFLPSPFNGIVLNANLTKLYSTTYKNTNRLINTDSIISFSPQYGLIKYSYTEYNKREVTIPGQVPIIMNLSIGYELKGFTIRLSGNHQGIYLSTLGESTTGLQDRYREGFWRWDLAVKQKLNNNLEVFFNANNLNNMKEIETVAKQVKGSTTITGSVYNLGLRLKL